MPAPPESRPARYLALLYSPASQRSVLEALLGIEREVSSSLRPGLDHQVAHARLQWWREECERAAGGRPVHPLTRALVEAVGRSDASLTAGASAAASASPAAGVAPATAAQAQLRANSLPQLAGLSGLVDVAQWDLAGATFETRRELAAYCERWAAAMIESVVTRSAATPADAPLSVSALTPADAPLSVSALTPADAPLSVSAVTPAVAPLSVSADAPSSPAAASGASTKCENHWRALGAAIREIELIADLAQEAHYGRLRVPLDELESAKADPSVLAKPPWPAALADLLQARHRWLRDEITRALRDVDAGQQPAVRGLLVWAALAWRSSKRAERALPDQLRPGRFDAAADAWFAWRIARRATLGRVRLN